MDTETVDLKIFMDYCDLIEIKVIWNKYIWFNGYISLKIDRMFCNFYQVIVYDYIAVDFREFFLSDYFSIVVDINEKICFKKFFRFVNFMIDFFDYSKTVAEVWNIKI